MPLSFSTIMAGDVGPYQDPDIDPADANAGGSIGIIVDIHSNDCVVTVGPNDDGTSVNPTTGEFISGGYPPTPERCAWSIDGRKTSNEWFVRDYRPIGIFAYGPILVRGQSGGEGEVPRDAAFACFPQFRIFSARGGQFIEFDSETKKWNPVSYDTIMNATVRPAE